MSKHQVFIKQLMKQAIIGSPQACRIYLSHLRLALETRNLMTERLDSPTKRDITELTLEELELIILAGETKEKVLAECLSIISDDGCSARDGNEISKGS